MSASMVLLNLLGAVALLLWGLRMVRTAAERVLKGDLDRHLRRATGNRVKSFVFGAIGAATLQSSTAIVLLGAGFVANARMTLAAGLAVALGADVGAAVAAQILTLDIREIAPAALFSGYLMFQFSATKTWRNVGRALIGLGLLFVSLEMIVGLSDVIKGSSVSSTLIASLANEPTLAILVMAFLTWIAHSSLAVVLLIASLAAAGAVSGSAVLYLLLGANLGAALPALMGSMTEPMAGRRVPVGNLVFRALGVLVFSVFVGALYERASGAGFSDSTIVVGGHLAFNLSVALISLPLTPLIARGLERFLPSRVDHERPRSAPRHLHPDALDDPARALANARREALRLADLVQEMLDDSEDAFAPEPATELQVSIGAMEDDVDSLNAAIKFYVTRLTREQLSLEQSRLAQGVIAFSTNMEHIADVVDRNILRLADRKRKAGLAFSPQGAMEIAEIYRRLRQSMQTVVAAFMGDNEELAEQLITEKRTFRMAEHTANQLHLERLREGNSASIDTSAIHLDLLRDLKRVHSHLTSIAYAIAGKDHSDWDVGDHDAADLKA